MSQKVDPGPPIGLPLEPFHAMNKALRRTIAPDERQPGTHGHRILIGSLAPHMQNFTLTAFLPVSPRRHNREIIKESMGEKILLIMDGITCST